VQYTTVHAAPATAPSTTRSHCALASGPMAGTPQLRCSGASRPIRSSPAARGSFVSLPCPHTRYWPRALA